MKRRQGSGGYFTFYQANCDCARWFCSVLLSVTMRRIHWLCFPIVVVLVFVIYATVDFRFVLRRMAVRYFGEKVSSCLLHVH